MVKNPKALIHSLSEACEMRLKASKMTIELLSVCYKGIQFLMIMDGEKLPIPELEDLEHANIWH